MEDRGGEPHPELCTQGGLYANVLNAKGRTVLALTWCSTHQATTERHGALVHVLLPKRL